MTDTEAYYLSRSYIGIEYIIYSSDIKILTPIQNKNDTEKKTYPSLIELIYRNDIGSLKVLKQEQFVNRNVYTITTA